MPDILWLTISPPSLSHPHLYPLSVLIHHYTTTMARLLQWLLQTAGTRSRDETRHSSGSGGIATWNGFIGVRSYDCGTGQTSDETWSHAEGNDLLLFSIWWCVYLLCWDILFSRWCRLLILPLFSLPPSVHTSLSTYPLHISSPPFFPLPTRRLREKPKRNLPVALALSLLRN